MGILEEMDQFFRHGTLASEEIFGTFASRFTAR